MTDVEREAEIRQALSIVSDHPNTAAIFLLARLDHERGNHDRRVTALLQANTVEVEKRRAAQAEADRFNLMLRHCVRLLAIIAAPRPEGDDSETALERDQREAAWACLETVSAACPDIVADSRVAGHA